jgi:hypothetical protein
MDLSYVFLCGLMWCRYGHDEAGCELVRAIKSDDPDVKALAWALLTEREPLKQRSSAVN